MEFTTDFTLYSQTRRLSKHLTPIPATRDTGLAPSLEWSLTQENLRTQAASVNDVFHATVPATVASSRIRRWAGPISLAVTIGIPVGFFSSA